MNLLAIDIGNTNIALGIFKGEKLVARASVATGKHRRYAGALERCAAMSGIGGKGKIGAVIVSSVVPDALKRIRPLLRKNFADRVYVVGKDVKAPITNLYKKPRQVGQDRLVNAASVKRLYGCPAIVIDFGTAVTFDCISRRGEYLGGMILPGIEMSFQSLYERTALLPSTRLFPPKYIIGRDTSESIRSGILYGYSAMCDGLVKKLKEATGKNAKVVATGGDCRLMMRHSGAIQIADPDLTLKGLKLTFEHAARF
ncbi:MAG: type III pantothenate kinase [Candidatus Omnitrophota bacterium]